MNQWHFSKGKKLILYLFEILLVISSESTSKEENYQLSDDLQLVKTALTLLLSALWDPFDVEGRGPHIVEWNSFISNIFSLN